MLQFEKYFDYSSGTLSGANYDEFGIGTALAGLFQAITQGATNAANERMVDATNEANLQIARETNEANYAIAQETNKANKDIADAANQLAREEAEKSYQRSTASNQIAELRKAGFSPQQAKQIVGSSGSSPSYSPAPVQTPTMQAATMQPATMQAPQYNMEGVGQGLGSAIGFFGDDALREDGGALGAIESKGILNEYFPHMDEIDEDAWASPASFQRWYRDKGNQEKYSWLTPELIKKTDSMFNHVQATRSFMYQGNKLQATYSLRNQVRSQNIAIKQQLIHLRIENATAQSKINMQLNDEQLQEMDKTLKTWKVNLSSYEFNTKVQELNAAFEKASLELQKFKDPEYKKAWLAYNLSDIQSLKALADAKRVHAEYVRAVDEQKATLYKTFGPWITTWEIFKDLGFTKTDAGIAAALVAGTVVFGINSVKKLTELTPEEQKEREDAIKAVFNGSTDKTTSVSWIDNK